ncbi:MAG TPA: YdhR family protein [Adhaeribacter sp.]|nr:YdhR family protein [Adhaeribacter sp.]
MKALFPIIFPALALASCTDAQLQKELNKLKAENEQLKKELQQQNGPAGKPAATFVQLVKLKSQLSDSAVTATMNQRKPRFMEVPGLVQKYYLKAAETGEYGGLYLWASEQDFKNYRQSELAKTIAKAYLTEGSPRVEVFEVLFLLQEE